MLRKTDHSRNSIKGRKGSDASMGINGSPTDSPTVVYQTPFSGARRKPQAPSPIKHQIAPGLVIEGEEVDL